MLFLALLLALVPGSIWLFFYLEEDSHSEPKRLVALTFLAGAAFALLALVVQVLLNHSGLTGDPIDLGSNTSHLTAFLISILLFAFVEEILKFTAAFLVVRRDKEFNQPLDAMIYMVVAALGFATVENLGVVIPPAGQSIVLTRVAETLALRFIGATLLHTLTAGLLGYYWAMEIRSFGARRYLVWGIVLATLLHAIFNYLIIWYGNLIYSLVFIIGVGFLMLSDFEKLKQRTI